MPANNALYPTSTFSTISVTSTSSTSFVTAGGATIAGNLTVTGSITGGSISYASTTTGTLAVSNASGTTFTVASTTNSTSVGTGSFVAQGGGSFAGNLYIGGSLVAGTVTYATTSTGTMAVTTGTGTTLTVSSVDDSTTTSNGSATFTGGVGIAKRVNVGSLKAFDSTQSTSTSTGAIIISGGLGLAGNIWGGGVLNITNNTASTSTTTGCAVFTGGIGVAGKIVADSLDTVGKVAVGGFDLTLGFTDQSTRGNTGTSRALVKLAGSKLYVNYANDFGGGTVIDSALNTIGVTTIENIAASTSTSTGALIVNGGLGVQGMINGSNAKFFTTTDSTSLSSGAVQIDGGLGVQFNISASSTHLYATYSSTSTTTGALIVDGGAGIAGTLSATAARIYATTVSTSTTTGAFRVDGGFGLVGNLSGSTARFYDTTASTSTTTGSVIFDGGIGVAGKISFDTCRSYNTTDSTSKTTGGVVLDGGLGVAKKIWSDSLNTVGNIECGGFDLRLGTTDQSSRGNTGQSRALVKQNDGATTQLVINFAADFNRAVVQSDLQVDNNLRAFNFWTETIDPVSFYYLSSSGGPATTFDYNGSTIDATYNATFAETPTFQTNITRCGNFYSLNAFAKFRLKYQVLFRFQMRFNSTVKLLPTMPGNTNNNAVISGVASTRRALIWFNDNKSTNIKCFLYQKPASGGYFNYYITTSSLSEVANVEYATDTYEYAGSFDVSHPDQYYFNVHMGFQIPVIQYQVLDSTYDKIEVSDGLNLFQTGSV